MTLESSDPQSRVLLGVRRTRQKPHQADAVALGRGLQTPTHSSVTAWWPFKGPVSRCFLSASRVLGIVWGPGGISSEVCAVPPGLVAEADGCFGSGGWVHDRAAVPAPPVTLGLPGGEPFERCLLRGVLARANCCLFPLSSLLGQGDVIAALSLAGASGQPP